MQALNLKVPPVIVFLLSIGIMYWFRSLELTLYVSLPLPNTVFLGCFVAAGYFGISGIREFKKAKTSVHPVDIHKTTKVVDKGVYQISRNPMYFGLLLLLIGFGYWLQDLLNLTVCVAFVLYMNRFQIRLEEQHLESKFGKKYIDYKNRVRRWI